MNFNYSKMSIQELRNLQQNAEKHDRSDVVAEVVKELVLRGSAKARDLSVLSWNQERVREVMVEFKKVAQLVNGNLRTCYTEAGALRIARKRTAPDWMWVDSYCAIKTKTVNAEFVCHIDRPGNEPIFLINLSGNEVRKFQVEDLPSAIEQWREIADSART